MGGHVDKCSFVRRGFVDNHLCGCALLHRALYVGTGKRSGNCTQILFAASYSVFDHGIEKMGFFWSKMLGDLEDIDDLEELYGQLQPRRKKARVGQNFFRRL